VIFVVYLGAILTTINLLWTFTGFSLQVVLWLWFTVLFANFAESLAEGRCKAQAEALRKMRVATQARLWRDGKERKVAAAELCVGDQVICETGDVIPGDGEVVQGIASVDESAITGESAPVIREAGGDRSAVTGGTRVLSTALSCASIRAGQDFSRSHDRPGRGRGAAEDPNELALEVLPPDRIVSFVVITLPATACI
jgi:K+-transporting ATPase ATPase B chain